MSNFRGHSIGGISAFFISLIPNILWLVYHYNTETINILMNQWWIIPISFICSMIGAWLPDTDIKSKSQFWIYLPLIIIDGILILFMRYRMAALLGFAGMLPNLTKHRGFMHSPISAFILPLFILTMGIIIHSSFTPVVVVYYISCVCGYFSHLYLDRK